MSLQCESIIVLPKSVFETTGQYDQFGYYETIGNYRPTQEDALIRHLLAPTDLFPKEAKVSLPPKEIAEHLKSCYLQLDKGFMQQYPNANDGTTAITTVYDHQGNLITALLGDAAAFAVAYDEKGKIAKLFRLNAKTHKPDNVEEKTRIEACGGFVSQSRVNGNLAISRAIGDSYLKSSGVTSEASIDTVRMIGHAKIHIILTCDGFTDAAGHQQDKEAHEAYLLKGIEKFNSTGSTPEKDLAEALAKTAIADGSTDNVSVAIQTITHDTPPFLLGVYDGHGGARASTFVAREMGGLFKKLCQGNSHLNTARKPT